MKNAARLLLDGRIKSDVVVHEAELIIKFIQKLAPFRGLGVPTLAAVADKLWAEQRVAGDVIFRQGDAGENFYVIRQGSVHVVRESEGQEQVINTLGEGRCFGEEALLTGNPRNATIRVAQASVLYVLGKEDFQEAVSASDSLREELRKALFERQ